VILNSGDRVVARDHHGRYQVYHDDNVLLRRPGTHLTTERYHDGSVLSRILYPSGIVIYTVSAFDGRMLRRWVQYPDRPTVVLFDDTRVLPPPVLSRLPPRSPVNIVYTDQPNPDLLRTALMARPLQPAGRFFNLDQIRSIPEVRYLAPEIEIATLNFASGSAAVSPDQAQTLAVLAQVMDDMIARNPAELFLIEGHSDAVGDPVMNLALSDARAEATAAAMTEYFGVPPQNMVTQGYGESDRKQQTQRPNEANRRIILRRITELLPPAAE
jgi:outer membrane protein OmpA-like peptidoglycan-associated protein|nr:OmpA family protein [Allgaiera sp.]